MTKDNTLDPSEATVNVGEAMKGKKLHEVKPKSFKITKEYLELHSNETATDLEIGIPLWMLGQIIEEYLGVKIK